MSYRDDGASSHFSHWQSQPGPGRGSAHDPADDHRSIYSADSRNSRSPLSVNEVGAVTHAQAYASAVKTGETHDRALYYTIERKQPERKGRANLQLVPSHLGHPGFPEHGLSFAQRLYASAVSHESSTPSSSDIPVLPPIKYASSSALPISGGSQSSSGVPPRQTSLSTSLFDTNSEVSQSFNPADLYHTSVTTHGFPSRGSTSPGVSAMRPPPLLPVLQIPHSLPVTRLSHPVNPQASYSSSRNSTLRLEVQNPHPVPHQFQTVSTEAQSSSTPVVSIHEASGLQGASLETHRGFHSSAVAGGAMPQPPPLEQQLVTGPSFSPPAFEEHERLPNSSEAVVADLAPVVIQSLAAVPYEGGLPDSLLQPPPEANHEAVPLYSLVDEQLPPPAFDDLQATNATEASAERSLVVHPETLLQEEICAPSSPSPPPLQSPPPFSHGSTAYAPGKAPVYSLLDKTSYSVGTSKNILQDAKTPLSPITIGRPSGPSSSNPPSVVPTDSQWPNQPPSISPPISPLHSNFHSLSMLSSHSPDQSRRASCDSLSIRKSTTISPPPVNYHTKPTIKQSGQPFLPPPAPQSGSRTPEVSNMVKPGRHDPHQPIVNVVEDNDAIDALTRSMSNMMGWPSSDAHSLAFETLPCGRQIILGTSLGNQQNIPIIPGSHPSGTPRTIGSLNQESRSEAGRLIQEAYRQSTHGETGGRAGYRIQGLGSANPLVVTNILSSQHLPRTISSPGPIPPAYSHDELQTESVSPAGGEFILSQFGETVASSFHSDRHHIAPSRSFPDPLQPSHCSIDRDVHGPVPPSGSVPLQQEKLHSLKNLDPMRRGGHGFPPPPPPPPPPIALQPWNVLQEPQTSLDSQDSAKHQLAPGIKALALNSNDLARKFAHDALLAPSGASGAPTYAFYGTDQR